MLVCMLHFLDNWINFIRVFSILILHIICLGRLASAYWQTQYPLNWSELRVSTQMAPPHAPNRSGSLFPGRFDVKYTQRGLVLISAIKQCKTRDRLLEPKQIIVSTVRHMILNAFNMYVWAILTLHFLSHLKEQCKL